MGVIVVCVVGATAAISVALGALAHRNLPHSIAVGFYVVGAGALVGTLAFGLRGPRRRDFSDVDADRPSGQFLLVGAPRKLRRTTAEERSEARRNSLLFFAFAILLLALGAAVDPTRSLV